MRPGEKTTLAMTLLLIVVSGAYFAAVLGPATSVPAQPATFTAAAVTATSVLAILTVTARVVLALMYRPAAVSEHSERDLLVALRAERVSGAVLAVGMFLGIVLAMLQLPVFWIAQSLIAAWVGAEIGKGAVKLVLFRQDALIGREA